MRISGLAARLFQQKRGSKASAFVAFILQPQVNGASLSPSHARDVGMRRQAKTMKLVRQLVVLVMLVVFSTGVFAQRKDQDKRPPKEPVKVITNDRKENRPPPKNDNRPKPDDRKRP